MDKNYVFILNGQEYTIQFSLKLFNKLGDAICRELINTEKYLVRSNVSNENFQVFLDFLNDKIQTPELTTNNYYDYFLLSEEFNKNLSDYLSKQEFNNIKNLSILKNAKTEEARDKSYFEEYIAEHLDYYLEFFSKEMSQIPLQTLYNVFQHKNRILNNHERAYKFIKEILTKSDNDNNTNLNANHKNACILLQTLDATKISEDSFNESYSKKSDNFGFAPEFNLSFVSEIKIQMNALMKQQMQMMEKMNSLFDQKIVSFHESVQVLTKKIDETNDEVKKLSQKVGSIESKVDGILKNDGETKAKIDEISTDNKNIKTDIESLSKKVGSIESKADGILKNDEEIKAKINVISTDNEKVKTDIESLSQKTGSIESKVDGILKNDEETKAKINEISTDNKKVKSDIESISQKVGSIKSEVKQSINESEKIDNILTFSIAKKGIIRQLTHQCGGNVSDKGIVSVTATGATWGPAKNVVDLDSTNFYGSKDTQDSFIKYNFNSKKVRPFSYLIKSNGWSKDDRHPKSWVIEGSNTDSSNDWTVMDPRTDCMLLNEPNASHCFTVQKSDKFYQFLRIRQTGKNTSNNYYFIISSLEYFGLFQ